MSTTEQRLDISSQICMLGSDYQTQVRSLLYQAYRFEPTFEWLFEAERIGYEQRVRATLRELVQAHFAEGLPVIGLFVNERLVGAALVAATGHRLDITQRWSWRLRMLLTSGFRCTKRYLIYHQAILNCLPNGVQCHLLPLLGIHPDFRGKRLGEQLLNALHRWCAENQSSQGLVLDTGNAKYLNFYTSLGYQKISEVSLGSLREYVFFHPNPQGENRNLT